MVESKVGRAALKQLYKMLGKSTVNLISKVAGTYLARMWNDDERGFRQTMGETLPDAFYEGLIGTLIDSIRSVLDSIDEKETQERCFKQSLSTKRKAQPKPGCAFLTNGRRFREPLAVWHSGSV